MNKAVATIGFLLFTGSLLYSQVPCFNGDDFSHQRERLLAEVSDGVILLDAASSPAEFFYLTGVESGEAKLILVPERVASRTPRPEAWKTTLYLPVKTPRMGTWEDPPLCYGDDSLSPTGISANAPLTSFMGDLAKLGNITETIYMIYRQPRGGSGAPGPGRELVQRVEELHLGIKIRNLATVLDRLRWEKTAKEIEIMRRGCDITVDAFKEAARYLQPGQYEYEIEALIDYIFRRSGSQEAAFLIVGSGPNSCVLHHSTNDRLMGENELLVIDVGTRYCSLSTDLTRTLPTSGKFTDEQRRIYNIVLEAQEKAISIVKPGVTLSQVHKAALDVIADAGYGSYFFHGTSHTLNGGSSSNPKTNGLFDTERQDRRYEASDAPLVPGSMFTIEPGIYIPEKNLGIRIEDDILVTADGHEVLTAGAPKKAEEVEALMKEALVYLKK